MATRADGFCRQAGVCMELIGLLLCRSTILYELERDMDAGRRRNFPLARAACVSQSPAAESPGSGPSPMKAKIIITPKKAVLDPQGKTVEVALAHMGYTGVT